MSGSPSRADSLRSQTATPNPFSLPSLPYRDEEIGESVHESSPENSRRPGSSAYYTTAWGSPYAAPSPRALSLSLSQKNAVVGQESAASSPRSMRSGLDHSSTNNDNNKSSHHHNSSTLTHHDNQQNGDGHHHHLKPAGGDGSARNLYSSGILNRSPGRDPVGRKGGKSIKDFTQDWINQYLSGQSRSERSNWLSDDSGSEAPSFFTAQNHFVDDDWLGLEDDSRNDDLLKTPTLADFATRKKGSQTNTNNTTTAAADYAESIASSSSNNNNNNPTRRKPRDYAHKRTDTLKQEDFWGFAYDKDPDPITTMDDDEITTESVPVPAESTSPVDKPLPRPSEEKEKKETTTTTTPNGKDYSSASSHTEPGEQPGDQPGEPEAPTEPAASAEPTGLPAEPVATSAFQPQEEPKPTPPPLARTPTTATLQRSRKKIPWRGKACIIALPLEDKRGSEEFGYRLLTPRDVEERLKNWQDEGHDIRGFRVSTPVEDPSDPDALELGGLSRPSFPDSDELEADWRAGRFGVRIPDRAEWDSYVAFLQEEKLRALGVSLGEEEGENGGGGSHEEQLLEDDDGRRNLLHSVSPASAAMSQMAPFPGLIASPPVPTASAASNNPLAIPHPFSPQLNQSTNSPGIGSLASPASQFSVQTPFLGVDHHQHLLGGYPLPFQPTPPAHGSFTPQSFLNARQTGTLPGNLPNLTSMLSPVSPLNDPNAFQAALDQGNKDFEDQFHPGMSSDDGAGGHPHDPHHLPRVQTPTEHDNFHSSTVEIAHPTPRGHSRGQNLSETLQKGLDQIGPSDYHLERSIERQLDEDDREAGHDGYNNGKDPGLLTSRWAMPDSAAAYHNNNQHDGSDIDTNPSLSGVPHGHGPLANDISWHESKPSHGSHRSKLSASTFNVEAKEFDPVGAFSPPNFPFQNNAFQFQGMDSSPSSLFTFGAGQQGFPAAGAGAGAGAAAPLTESFNVAAPAFNPSGIDTHQKQAPSGEFKFSSASFNVEAPAFNPGASVGSTTSSIPPPSGERTKIFGDIDFAQISKPTKKSKAIPIVRPDEIENDKTDSKDHKDKDHKEKDNDIEADVASLQSVPTDRNKRARHDAPSDEEVDMNVPTRALNEAKNSQGLQESPAHTHADGKENAGPEDETAAEVKRPATMERRDTPVSEASTWAPPDGKDQLRDAITSSPVRHQAPGTGATKRGFDTEQQLATELEDSASTPVAQAQDEDKEEESAADKAKNTSTVLSPDAKPFEFKAGVPEFVPPSEKPASVSKPAKGLSSLMSSRYATASPPSSPKDKPLPPEPPRPEPAQKDQPVESKARQLDESDDRSTDEEDINAIMEQINDDSDLGVERINTPQPATKAPGTIVAPSKEKRHAPAEARSEAPSPSPGREPTSAVLQIPTLDFEAQSHTSGTPSKMARSSVRQLGAENDHVSDWDDVVSSAEDEKLVNRSKFFDRRINDLVGSVIEERLTPLERALGMIQQSMTSIASGAQNKWTMRSTSATGEDSDADDEDDEYPEASSIRARSPLNQKDRKLDKLKGIIQDALATRVPASVPEPVEQDKGAVVAAAAASDTSNEIMQLRQSFAELQEFTKQNLVPQQQPQQQQQEPSHNLRSMIQETIAAQMSVHAAARPSSDADEIGADSLMLQVSGLKDMLRLADDRAEQEYKLRRESQDAIAELQRLLKVAEEDAARHSSAAESAETRFLAFKEENLPRFEEVHARSSGLSEERESLRLTLAEISSKNITLQGTLDEHRVSGESWKRESEKNKADLEKAQDENKKLLENIDHLRRRLEDGVNIRKKLSDRFDRLQDEMATVTRDIAQDQAAAKEVRAAHSREVKLRERLEADVRELEQQEREAAKLKFIFAQSQQENARLEDLVGRLRLENQGLETKAARFEREFNDARETTRVEIQRTKTSLEADVEAANSQVNIVRAELEGQIIRLQNQQESIRLDADTARERYEMLLEEANEAKANAVASKEMALDDQRRLHERGLNDLRERHARALHNSSEDKQRQESYMGERLQLSESKTQHFQERVQHLEEKLEITQSAARAAAEAASKGGVAVPNMPAPSSTMFSKSSSDQVPEKISPQALRESILVLQDQLQQREARIDELEQDASSMDKNAPTRIKEQDTEITWLRELLGVRIDDLQDIITTLSQPSFDQQSVRDAAIRLRANLQMQLQEQERAHDGHGFTSLPSISDLAATPRALPLAAAAAWGNWRRTSAASTANDETPSKSKPGSFLSGLLTPPASQARQSPRTGLSAAPPTAGSRRTSETRPLRGFNPTPRPLSARTSNNNNNNNNNTTTTTAAAAANTLPESPKTPPLLRRSSYDHDAEPTDYEHGSVADEMVSASPKEVSGESPKNVSSDMDDSMEQSFTSQSSD